MNIKKTNTGYENSFIFVACIHLKQISKPIHAQFAVIVYQKSR